MFVNLFINQNDVFYFLQKELTTDKNDRILDNVRRAGWDAYIKFKIILIETKQEECVKQLQNREQCFIKGRYSLSLPFAKCYVIFR